jgi:hypothetical protein
MQIIINIFNKSIIYIGLYTILIFTIYNIIIYMTSLSYRIYMYMSIIILGLGLYSYNIIYNSIISSINLHCNIIFMIYSYDSLIVINGIKVLFILQSRNNISITIYNNISKGLGLYTILCIIRYMIMLFNNNIYRYISNKVLRG